jgi:hypothetical protein
VFFVNVPFGLLTGLVLAVGLAGLDRPRRAVRVDVRGAVLLTAGMGGLLLALVEGGRHGRFGPWQWGFLVVAVALLVEFVRWERRVPAPLLPHRLFANRMFRAAAVSGFLAGMAMFGTISFIPSSCRRLAAPRRGRRRHAVRPRLGHLLRGLRPAAPPVGIPVALSWAAWSVSPSRSSS